MDFVMRPVRPIRPVVGYVGGKKLLAGAIIERIEAIPHGVYAEPFVGMGGVFFRRRAAPKCEAINDISGDIATFFRVLQNHYQALMDMLKWQVASRAEFERLMGLDPDHLTDLQRAARFLFLQASAFGGKVAGRSFGVHTTAPARFDPARLQPLLAAAHERLGGVFVERLPWADFIPRYDRPETLFFLDPPYWGSEDYYGRALFPRADYERLAGALKALRGRFILTVNDVPELRALFGWAAIEEVGLTYRVSGGVTPAREIIVSRA